METLVPLLESVVKTGQSTETQCLASELAKTLNNNGNATLILSQHYPGKHGTTLLEEAEEAYENALNIKIQHNFEDQAGTQSALSFTLYQQALRTTDYAGKGLLEKALELLEAALKARLRSGTSLERASTRIRLGDVLRELALRLEGPNILPTLRQSKQHYQDALEELDIESTPAAWTAAKINLANVRQEIGIREVLQGNSELDEAVKIYQEVLPHVKGSQRWAIAQSALGLALQRRAQRQSGDLRAQDLSAAHVAYRQALKERSPSKNLTTWAETQGYYFTLRLDEITSESENPEILTLLETVRSSCSDLINLLPNSARLMQSRIELSCTGRALYEMAIRDSSTKSLHYLDRAAEQIQEALNVFSRESFPQNWAEAQNSLGNILREYAARATTTRERLRNFNNSRVSYDLALEVRTREALPQDWAETSLQKARLEEYREGMSTPAGGNGWRFLGWVNPMSWSGQTIAVVGLVLMAVALLISVLQLRQGRVKGTQQSRAGTSGGNLSIQLTSSRDRSPIGQAEVTIVDLKLTVVSDDFGVAEFTGLKSGPQDSLTVTVAHPEFQTKNRLVRLGKQAHRWMLHPKNPG